jgi:hypothetical protein
MLPVTGQLVIPILTETTAGLSPKLEPCKMMFAPPIVGPFLGLTSVMVGASYLTGKDAT